MEREREGEISLSSNFSKPLSPKIIGFSNPNSQIQNEHQRRPSSSPDVPSLYPICHESFLLRAGEKCRQAPLSQPNPPRKDYQEAEALESDGDPRGDQGVQSLPENGGKEVDAVHLIDANRVLSGIITDKDTIVSKVMTRNPTFVMADTLAMEALQKMVQDKFRRPFPVVENGKVIAILGITKCLYNVISRMEKGGRAG
ncbi:CBS domain-containing protein CBSCBSPB3-like [Iris pallida]|uniref:CBS domain-containing protein CBSCBSPB3-like n=1 Tax=Iris pallida TaxID=29817 RepID=A0AAX6FT22_IRIPA|nr:CBS domain-containing protein CBSCBSPB3-like [Iris pallida]